MGKGSEHGPKGKKKKKTRKRIRSPSPESSPERVQFTPTKKGTVKAVRTGSTGRSSHEGQRLGKWTPQQMKEAFRLVKEENYSRSAAAVKTGLPTSTFKDRCRLLLKAEAEGKNLEPLFGHMSGGKNKPRLFTVEEERELEQHLLVMADSGFGMTPGEFRCVVHQWAQNLGKSVSEVNEAMSWNFLYWFTDRHPSLKVLKPQEMSLYRATAPRQEVIDVWFQNLDRLMTKYNIQGHQVWNVDESGIANQPKAQKVFTRSEAVPLQIVPGERASNTTVLAFANALGHQTTPIIVMKGKNVQPNWRTFKPADWPLFASENGYVNKDIILASGRHFLRFLQDNGWLGQHHILLLDGHSTHNYNYKFAMNMAANKVHVVVFPPHCTHFMQPYDGCPLASLKRCYQDAMRIWNRQHAGQRMSKEQFFIVFRRAWRKAMTPAILQAGFRQVGIWPLNYQKVNESWFKAREALGEIKYPTSVWFS